MALDGYLRYETHGEHASLPRSCILRPEMNASGLRARISDNVMGGICRLIDAITERTFFYSDQCLECSVWHEHVIEFALNLISCNILGVPCYIKD